MRRSIDDYGAIRARRDKLRQEHDRALSGKSAPATEVNPIDLLRAVFEGEGDPLPVEWRTPDAADRKHGLPAASGEPKRDGS
jgi:hypothetical protein